MSESPEGIGPWHRRISAAVFAEAEANRENLKATKDQPSIIDSLYYTAKMEFRRFGLSNVLLLFKHVRKFDIACVTFFVPVDDVNSDDLTTTIGSLSEGITVREWLVLLSMRLSEIPNEDLLTLECVLNLYHWQTEVTEGNACGNC